MYSLDMCFANSLRKLLTILSFSRDLWKVLFSTSTDLPKVPRQLEGPSMLLLPDNGRNPTTEGTNNGTNPINF